LVEKAELDVCIAVAGNESTPKDVLAQLAKHKSWYVRKTVATNPSTPKGALAKLAEDEDEYVRETVAENSSAYPELQANGVVL
jgi:3-methyladenine DNA glycosylase AlkC